MKIIYLFFFLLFTSISFGQTLIAKTEDGRRVILNKDKTWEFIDKVPQETTSSDTKFPDCNLPSDFKEPKGDNSAFLRRVDAT
ncbi:hypothetical protein [uncultured Tenacibaculum sp.]|uniref:hypothetical protein n=1 Tax=uncultured Tenacibaculum sp. TaxID=174713 RepID=UPI0026130B83|nr:hypothetical protein [uncultured Tenacibaculum sp.]